jgi:hypothetical protein
MVLNEQSETQKLRPMLLAAVKGVMQAHIKDLQRSGAVFTGQIMDISLEDNMTYLSFKFSDEFTQFMVNQIEKGALKGGLDKKTVIILDPMEI